MSVQAITWAMAAACDSPLEKLLLIYLADWFGMRRTRRVNRDRLLEACCCTDLALMEAIRGLDLSGHIRFLAYSKEDVDIELMAPREVSAS